MKSLLLALAIFALSTFTLQAQNLKNSLFSKAGKPVGQMPHFLAGAGGEYYLIVSNDTYTPLTGGTNITGGLTWDDPSFNIPIGFPFTLFGNTIDSILLEGLGATFTILDMASLMEVHFLLATHIDLIDRGVVAAGGVDMPGSQSPIVYTTVGTAPNRIFKMEWQNAGLYNEWGVFTTTNDFINLQYWLYEGSNNIEVRFGPASTGNGASYDIYDGQAGHWIGAAGAVNLNTFIAEEGLYSLNGTAVNPTLSFIDNFNFTNTPPTLTDSIPSGMVYRLSTSPQVGIATSAPVDFRVFPTLADDVLQYTHTSGSPLLLSVLDLTGRPVMETIQATDATGTLNIAHLPAGMYLVEAMTEGHPASAKRFVKQ